MKDAKFDLDIDDNMNGTLILKCGECSRKIKTPLRQASPGKAIKCGCGIEYSLSADDLRGAQKSLDDLQRTLNSFG